MKTDLSAADFHQRNNELKFPAKSHFYLTMPWEAKGDIYSGIAHIHKLIFDICKYLYIKNYLELYRDIKNRNSDIKNWMSDID